MCKTLKRKPTAPTIWALSFIKHRSTIFIVELVCPSFLLCTLKIENKLVFQIIYMVVYFVKYTLLIWLVFFPIGISFLGKCKSDFLLKSRTLHLWMHSDIILTLFYWVLFWIFLVLIIAIESWVMVRDLMVLYFRAYIQDRVNDNKIMVSLEINFH